MIPPPPAGWVQVTPAAALDGGLGAAPRDLRVLWALAAAAGVIWRAWRIGPLPAPDGWTLAVTVPGALQRYTWVRSGGRMLLVAQTETATAPGGRPRG